MAQVVPNGLIFFEECGPYGHQEKSTFNFVLDKTNRIKTVNIGTGDIVDGIGFEIVDQSGQSKTVVYYGGPGHAKSTISLQDNDYITHISGSEGIYFGKRYVAQLFIHTNSFPSGIGPYGRKEKCTDLKSFTSPVGTAVGFFGSTDTYLASIGISLQKEPLCGFTEQYGPYGRQETPTFNLVLDQTDRFKTVNVGFGDIVDGLGFEIVNQSSGESKTVYYGAPGHETVTIRLQDDEYITHISGSHGKYDEKRYVAELFIHTNLNPGGVGPYGRMKNCTDLKIFKSPVGTTVGFYGSIDTYLASIGITKRN